MIKNEYTLIVDIKKKYSGNITPTFVQYDTAVLRFILTDGGKAYYFSGQTSVKTYHRRKDGVVVEGDATVEIVKGQPQIVYEYQGNEMYQLGFVETSVVIYNDKKKVSIQPFKVKIVDNIYDDIATPANPEYGALQHLIVRVEDLIDRAVEAIDNANTAAENVQTTISEWKYADTYIHTTNYKKNNVVSYNGSTFIAIRDTVGNYPIGNLSDENWRIMALKGQDGVVVLNKEDFVATLNQTDFTLPLEYDQHQGRVRVIVDGVEQFTPENFIELSSTKVRLNSGLRKDANVKVIYFGNAPALKNDIQLQIDNINDLLEFFNLAEANTAISHATTQGDYAKVKGDEAKVATAQANVAKDNAIDATNNANIAKDATVIATNKANTAIALTETATSNANTATTNAITATNEAILATNNTKQATINANDAVLNLYPKGEYSSTVAYLPRNIVSYLGSSYMNIVASKGILPTDTTKWQPVGSKGETGFGFTWRGEYNPNDAYIRDDVVYSNGSSYIALKSVAGILPSNDKINWNILTQRGIDGAGSVSSVNGISPDLNGDVVVPTVTSVNGQTGVITGLETVIDSNDKLATKVDKVVGKQLSTNDYTTAEKDKLTNIAPNANNYVHLTTSGYKHIPSGGATGNFLKYSTDGTAAWSTPTSADITESPSKKFTSDTKIAEWDAKATPEYVDNKIGVLSKGLNDHSGDSTIHVTQNDKTKIANASQVGHQHIMSDITGLNTELDDIRLTLGQTASEEHDHEISNINGLQDALDSKSPSSTTGDLTTLTTDDKTSVVNAINEINAKPSSGGSEWAHIGEFSPGHTTYGISRFNVEQYRKVKFIIKGLSKTAYAADKLAYLLELELYSPSASTNTHFQRTVFGGSGITNTGNKLQLLHVTATSDNNIPPAIYGEIEIDFTDPYWFTKSRLYWMNNSYTSGSTGEVSGRTLMNETIVEGRRTFNRSSIPLHVTLTYSDVITFGKIEMLGIPR